VTQVGSVVVFKPGVSREQALESLRKLTDVIDLNYYVNAVDPVTQKPRPAAVRKEMLQKALVNEFDPAYGGPVWYVP